MKLTASYRFDGYWGALKTISTGGALTNTDRFYNGPMLRFTAYTGGAPAAASALYVPSPGARPMDGVGRRRRDPNQRRCDQLRRPVRHDQSRNAGVG